MVIDSPRTILVTGASSGFGALTVRALADAGHTVYAGVRQPATRNAPAVAALDPVRGRARRVAARGGTRRAPPGVRGRGRRPGAGRRGPPGRGGAQRGPHGQRPRRGVHPAAGGPARRQRARRPAGQPGALPHLRERGEGLLVWIGSSSTRGGCPPFPGAVLRRQGRDGRAGGELRRRADPVRHRHRDRRARRVHLGHEPLRARGHARGHRAGRRLRRALRRPARRSRPAAGGADPAGGGRGRGRRGRRPPGGPAHRRPAAAHPRGSEPGRQRGWSPRVADRVRAEFFRRAGLEDLLTAGSSL